MVGTSTLGFSQLNNPYPGSESNKNIYYDSFSQRPKYLDPVKSYSADEYKILGQIYEPIIQYHYLKRPYQLIPLTAEQLPIVEYFDKDGKKLDENAPTKLAVKSVYTIKIKKGIKFQDHPCFAKDKSGKYTYHKVDSKKVSGYKTLFDFPEVGTRELTAADYVYQIKRMADPRNECPIFSTVAYIKGMKEYSSEVTKQINDTRSKRKENAGIFYNREEDEKQNPIIIDYQSFDCEGLKIIDKYTYQITLKQKYPQFIFWLSMPFFAPMPWEAIAFYNQKSMTDNSITLQWYPVGTGAYRMKEYNPNHRIILVANENYHGELYPSEGMPGDEALLVDAGKKLPLIPMAIYSKDKEPASMWRKFLQGYYDSSGISSENFSKVMDLTHADATLSDELKNKNIRLETSVATTIIYMGFNMLDPVVGGLEEKKCKLRQAISIAINLEEYLEIFRNGRGIVAQGPIPPGIFGYRDGIDGINPYTHSWDKAKKRSERHPIERAKKLMIEAGYPDGIDENGRDLTISFETVEGPGGAAEFAWMKKQLDQIGIVLKIDATDYNRFRQKMDNGKAQLFRWGWNADYPDPENFLFLLEGKQGHVKYHGPNSVNYSSPKFDALFEKMKSMSNTPERQKIIDEMIEIARYDSPWQFSYYPVSYGLFHSWFKNYKPNTMANNRLKFYSVDVTERENFREEHNKPKLLIVFIGLAIFLFLIIQGVMKVAKKEMNT